MFHLIPLLLLFTLSSPSPSPPAEAAASTAYEVLQSHGLPIGLLPTGVREFRVGGDGRFEALLDTPCTAKFESEVHYDANVTGTLSYGQIAALSGISAQELFLWFPVRGIRVDVPSSGLIYFDVGVIHKQFSLSLFETPPDCKVLPSTPSVEGSRIAGLVHQSQSGKLRYDLDQDDASTAASGADYSGSLYSVQDQILIAGAVGLSPPFVQDEQFSRRRGIEGIPFQPPATL